MLLVEREPFAKSIKKSVAAHWHLCDTRAIAGFASILTLSCTDRPGVVHAVAGFLLSHGGNIDEAAQYHDGDTGLFFMRVQFSCEGTSPADLRSALALLADSFAMRWELHAANQPLPTVLMVSTQGHCLNDLLYRWKSGLLHIDIRAVISNHEVAASLVTHYGLPFHHVPVTVASKEHAETHARAIISDAGAELIVLARYMQVLSPSFCHELAGRAINIHHSFLPSFKGSRPYVQAHDRGVKLIGATAHYVTETLDDGPIIEQDVARVDHSMSVEDLATLGRDTECQVLARAVKWHSERRVLLDGAKTVVFR